jgi:predicted ATPase
LKLRLENLGRIEKAEIDIRPLTVFIGKNGTNETWAAYALYGLVRRPK